jgi:hypothetical protein
MSKGIFQYGAAGGPLILQLTRLLNLSVTIKVQVLLYFVLFTVGVTNL